MQTALLAPDLVLADIRMPELDGIAANEAIVRDHPQTKVLGLDHVRSRRVRVERSARARVVLLEISRSATR